MRLGLGLGLGAGAGDGSVMSKKGQFQKKERQIVLVKIGGVKKSQCN
jgi:hypothetical protein